MHGAGDARRAGWEEGDFGRLSIAAIQSSGPS
jgi:hypothetical protein